MPHVVIVEDDPPIRRLYETKLSMAGLVVSVAENGSEGLKLIHKTSPDLVLLDIRMPKMNGDEMLAKLRATDWGATIRVIILTNISRHEAPSSLRFLNVDRYIVKAHYTPSQVLEIVNEVLSLPKSTRQ